MKIKFEKLGYIDKGEITPGNLTIVAGDNNTGKTYINYSLYSLLNGFPYYSNLNLDSIIKELVKNSRAEFDLNNFLSKKKEILTDICKNFKEELPTVFSSNSEYFQNTKIEIEIEKNFAIDKEYSSDVEINSEDKIKIFKPKDSATVEITLEALNPNKVPYPILESIVRNTILKLLFDKEIKHPFIITSERTGVSLFYKELDINKNILIEKIAKNERINLPDLFFSNLSRYPLSIKHNIDIVRDIWDIRKNKSFIAEKDNEVFVQLMNKLSEMMKGTFKIEESQIFFVPNKENRRKQVPAVPLYLSSSSTKSFLLLDLYIQSIARMNDILMIDEPELNLHPSNQINMARFLANLVNLGIDVFITTHSDYIIREFNNLIMLSNDFADKNRIMTENNYHNSEILSPNQIKAYTVADHTIRKVEVNNFGIDYKLFDDTITNLNQLSNDIYYSIKA